METIEKNTGLLTKDLIKKFIKREKELEDEIYALKEEIKTYNSVKNTSENIAINPDEKYKNLFLSMLRYASMDIDSSYAGSATLSINNYPLMIEDVKYIANLMAQINNDDLAITTNITTNKISSDCSSDCSSNLTNYYAVDGTHKINDRVWP